MTDVTCNKRENSPRATETGVDFDDTVFPGCRIERVLDIALADDTKMTDDFQSGRPEHVVLVVW